MNNQLATAIYDLIEAREMSAEATNKYGSRSQQLYDAITLLLNAQQRIEKYGSYGQRKAQITYANVWD